MDLPTPPESALAMVRPPPGFNVTLFAAEPAVQQPIGFTIDARGRLWVAENYTYAEAKLNFDTHLRDRIVILEDTNHDGRFDKRTVFWDKASKLTSVEVGFGGVWALCAPNLLFIPDRDGDGVPDGEPVVLLDGWNEADVRHNIVNGLRWGPDGWLYGRHGIMATSNVGKPGTPPAQRQKINCGIWRYHPTRHVFEVVAQGTTNPWGSDWDDYGELFFINTVIGHLWHVIPGAHYARMYGDDLDPHSYGLIEQHADHYHWDTSKHWTDSRDAKGEHNRLGGGHAHTGLMVYLADNWPAQYRNTLFTLNFHGRRLNNDLLIRSGSGYVGQHSRDLVFFDDPWFRPIDLGYGPDGAVFVLDWSDTGECHDSDGVHRESGRIYKVSYGQPRAPEFPNITALGDDALVRLLLQPNDFYVRQARRILQERAAEGNDISGARAALTRMLGDSLEVTRQLRVLWALNGIGAADETLLRRLLRHSDEHIRAWAIRLLTDQAEPGAEVRQEFIRMAKEDASGLVRLYLASSLQRLAPVNRPDLAGELLNHSEDASDHNLPLMIWYGLEPVAGADPSRFAALAGQSRIPLVRRFAARRLAEQVDKAPEGLDALLKAAAQSSDPLFHADILRGISDALRGWRKARKPSAWDALQAKTAGSENTEVREMTRTLSALFGDGRALDDLRKLAMDEKAEPQARRAAFQALLDTRQEQFLPLCRQMLDSKPMTSLAIRGLTAYGDPQTPELVIESYATLPATEQREAIAALTSRAAWAQSLLDAVGAHKIPRNDISAYNVRQLRALNDEGLNRKLVAVWGEIRGTDEEKQRQVTRYKGLLSPERLSKADLTKGHALFLQVCAVCHTLHAEGAKIGPDLTGAGRDNLDYLLENILDPSAVVGADYRMSIVTLKDGRVLTGMAGQRTDRTLTVQSQTEKVSLENAEIEEIQQSTLSLMPEGLLEGLGTDQVADLIAYLMAGR